MRKEERQTLIRAGPRKMSRNIEKNVKNRRKIEDIPQQTGGMNMFLIQLMYIRAF